MNLYQLVFSPTGGTKKITEIISAPFKINNIFIDLTARDYIIPDFSDDDVSIIAMPVFGGRIPSFAAERLHSFKGNNSCAVLLSVFGNRAIDDALVEMEDIATDCGFRVISAIEAVAEHSIDRQFGANRPDDKDKKILLNFSDKILQKINDKDFTKPILPGNRPYKQIKPGLKPYADDSCINCRICADKCPTGAISYDNIKSCDKDKCISCMRCISVCPVNARKNDPVMLDAVSKKLAVVCKERKENKLYI